jgi:uncharacterized protein YkwD
MLKHQLRHAVVGAAVIACLAAAAPTAISAPVAARQTARVRSYDHQLLRHSNRARTTHQVRRFAMNQKLHTIALAWAEHLAKTQHLKHNPRLASEVTKQCPRWTAIGENIGIAYSRNPRRLFRAYMNSPDHRANILDKRYTQVGIATVEVHRHGQLRQYDVMDFGNHC